MSELRQNIITKDWVVFATERAKRPHEFIQPYKSQKFVPIHHAHCPFCLGNESPQETELFCIEDDRGWRVRVVPNKYPAFSTVGDRVRKTDDIHRSISGVGFHEVVVEHPQHNSTIALMPVEDVVNIVKAYRQRYVDIRQDQRVETIIIFKNHGEQAGTSIEHPHSQIVATPVVPAQIRFRIGDAIQYFDQTGECIYCHTLRDELAVGDRLVAENEYFVAFIPYAALSPFHLWIFPRRHVSSFEDITRDVQLKN